MERMIYCQENKHFWLEWKSMVTEQGIMLDCEVKMVNVINDLNVAS